VPHRPLLDKLISIGLSDYLIKWICSYLSNMSHVVLNGQELTTTPVLSGIPQRSGLGLLPFLIYVQVLCLSTLHDDLLLYEIISCADNYTSLQLDINSVANWIHQHHLSLSVKCMIVTRLQQNSVSLPVLQLNGEPMEKVTTIWQHWKPRHTSQYPLQHLNFVNNTAIS